MNAEPQPSSPRGAGGPAIDAGLAPRPEFRGRTLPHSLEAEERLLACCMMDGRAAATRCIAAKIAPASFYDPAHARVFAAILALHARQEEIAAETVGLELQQSGELASAGGFPRLAQIAGFVATTAQLNTFLRVVREMWILREVIQRGTRLVEDCHGFSGNLTELLSPHVAWMQAALSRVVHGERAGVTLRERVDEVKGELAARASGQEDRSRWLYTGLADFDRKCLPIGSDAEDHLVLFGGGSGHGKSAVMRQWAGEALKAGMTVVNYTRETSVKGWVRQLASTWSLVDLRTLAEAPRDLAERLQAECDRIGGYVDKSLWVFQQEPGCAIETIEDLVAHARSWSWQHGAPHLLVVDYLQLFGTKRRCNNREQEVAHVSHTLQALQRELGCIMLVGAQLNETGLREMRQVRKTEDGRLVHRLPHPGDFRESQAMFHDADRVVAIYRPPENVMGRENYGPDVVQPEQWLVQIKRRYGGEGSVRCWFEKQFLRFREFGRAEHPTETGAEAPAAAASAEEKRRRLAAKKAAMTESPY